MAYNSNKGPQHSGDIQYEGDPNDVQIDFENDQIILKTGGAPRVNLTNTELSASGLFRTVGSISGSGNLVISGTMHIGDQVNSKAILNLGELTDAFKVTGAGDEYFRINTDGNEFYFRQSSKTRFGSHTVAPTHTVSVTGDISGSGITRLATVSASADVYVTGAVKAASFIGDGSALTGIASSASGSARLYSSTGIETSGFLRVSGSMTGSTGLHITGANPRLAIGDKNAEGPADGLLSIRPSDTSNIVLMMLQAADHEGARICMAVTGSGQVAVGGGHLAGVLNISGSNTETLVSAKNNIREVFSVSPTNSLSASAISRVETVSASSDVYVTGAVKAATFFGDGSNLTGISSGDTSGSARVYSVTGLETSGYLKVSGSSTLGGLVTATAGFASISGSGVTRLATVSASADVYVTGAVKAALFFGDGSNLTGISGGSASGSARVYSGTGLETSGYLKVSGSSTLNGVTATTYSGSSTMQVVGATILGGNLNVSGSTVMEGLTANGITNVGVYSGSNTLQNVGNVFFGGTVNASGSIKLQVNEPAIYFSNSAGTVLGEMGFNSSNNILIQNNFTNKHIVFKANDNGTLREGFRIDGAVPEVVVNQGSDSLVDFRVESNNNTHMIFSDGSADKVGINNSAPNETFSVVGNISGSAIARVATISASSDVYVTGAVKATTYYGDGSNLTGISAGVSGSSRVYSTTGLETSGYLKVSGSTTLAGTLRSAGKIESTNHAYSFGASTIHFVPLNGSTNESTTPDYRQQMIAPFNGKLRRVYARTKNNPGGNCTANITVASDGTEDFTAGGGIVESQTITISAANTTGTFNLTGSQHFTAGQIIGVAMQFNANPADVNITCVWEYDDRDV